MGELAKSFRGGDRTDTTSSFGRGAPDEQTRETLGQVAEEAKSTAQSVAGQARDIVSQRVTERAGRSADDLRQVAQTLRQSADQLGGNMAVPYVNKAAHELERLSDFLRHADATQVVRGVERFARREPLLFLGGAFSLGLLAARFLKSSARHGEYGGRAHGGESWGREGYDEGHGREGYGQGYGREGYVGEGLRGEGWGGEEYGAGYRQERRGPGYRGRDPRQVAHREYPQAATEPRGDISHSAEGPSAAYAGGAAGTGVTPIGAESFTSTSVESVTTAIPGRTTTPGVGGAGTEGAAQGEGERSDTTTPAEGSLFERGGGGAR